MQNRIHLGGALSGRDIEGVNKTVSALIKLLFPDPEMEIPDEDLEWVAIAELAVEKQAKVLLMPVSDRRGLNDLPDELWTKISIEFYKDPDDAVFKGLEE
jgi:ATP-dependent Lon protease